MCRVILGEVKRFSSSFASSLPILLKTEGIEYREDAEHLQLGSAYGDLQKKQQSKADIKVLRYKLGIFRNTFSVSPLRFRRA